MHILFVSPQAFPENSHLQLSVTVATAAVFCWPRASPSSTHVLLYNNIQALASPPTSPKPLKPKPPARISAAHRVGDVHTQPAPSSPRWCSPTPVARERCSLVRMHACVLVGAAGLRLPAVTHGPREAQTGTAGCEGRSDLCGVCLH